MQHQRHESIPDSKGEKITVLAVIIAYYPDTEQLSMLCESIQEQVAHTLIVDNSEGEKGALDSLPCRRVTIISLGTNTGIGSAQNNGIEWADDNGFSHVLLLDQDSLPAPGMVHTLCNAEQILHGQGVIVAAVGPQAFLRTDCKKQEPFIVKGRVGFTKRVCEPAGDQLIEVAYLHASGTLMKIAHIREIGPIDSSLFIDMLDMEWCFRATAKKYVSYGVCAAHIFHQVGVKEQIGKGRCNREISVHPPLRSYYQARNWVLLIRKKYVPRTWLFVYGIRNIWLRFCVLLVVAPNRKKRCNYFFLGVWHGLRRKSGRIDE